MANHSFYEPAKPEEYSKEYHFEVDGVKYPMTKGEEAIWQVQQIALKIGQEVGGDGKAFVKHPLYLEMIEKIEEGRAYAQKVGLTYSEVYNKVTAWFRKVVPNDLPTA